MLGPERTLSFVALPEGQDPDDLVTSGGREAVEALLAQPEPLVDRLWRHERDSGPLQTPEQRAGLKARLMAHAAAIAELPADALRLSAGEPALPTVFQ